MSKQPKQETIQPVKTIETVGDMKKPVIELHSSQLLTIYTELNTILAGLEEKYRYYPDISMNGDTPRRDFVTTRFVRLKKICDNISSYLLDLEDYKDAVCECFAYMTNSAIVEAVPERKLGVG